MRGYGGLVWYKFKSWKEATQRRVASASARPREFLVKWLFREAFYITLGSVFPLEPGLPWAKTYSIRKDVFLKASETPRDRTRISDCVCILFLQFDRFILQMPRKTQKSNKNLTYSITLILFSRTQKTLITFCRHQSPLICITNCGGGNKNNAHLKVNHSKIKIKKTFLRLLNQHSFILRNLQPKLFRKQNFKAAKTKLFNLLSMNTACDEWQ